MNPHPDFFNAPPTPSPGETVVSPTVTTTTTNTPMEKLPVTGQTDAAWGALALGVLVLAAGAAAVVTARVRRAREV